MAKVTQLDSVQAGMPLVFGGNRVIHVPERIAEAFRPGDALVVVEATEEILLIAKAERDLASAAVTRALDAFAAMRSASDAAISHFYEVFADRLEDERIWEEIRKVNEQDVAAARKRGRSTTRLVASDKLRRNMIDGLRGWVSSTTRRGQILETVRHDGWTAELIGAALGPVGFVFEGRPNVVADATGVLRGGNTVVFRIGRDALGTARAILQHALVVALQSAGLPEGAVCLIDSAEHAAGWALFSDSRLALAVARGSGPAVATLGALAKQAGVSVSLHGTGGAWLMASSSTRSGPFEDAVIRSLDRKVCNTLNVCCIPESRAEDLMPAFLRGLERAGKELGQSAKLHVAPSARPSVPSQWFDRDIAVRRAEGDRIEKQAVDLPEEELGREWEWEQTPEVSVVLVRDLWHGCDLFNRLSPQFVACLVSDDRDEQDAFYERVNAPFVGDGFTRWVDGQYALKRPELGLSNWQWGRLFGRGGVLSGDTVYTVRTRARGTLR